MCWLQLERAVAVGGSKSDDFSSYCPYLSLKTIRLTLNYEINKLFKIFV
jgi:hypothetical protein